MARTPGPLTVGRHDNGQIAIYSHRGVVALMEAGYDQTRFSDAAFIVTACNAHDGLVAALRDCLTDDGAFCYTENTRESIARRLSAINDIARAALKGIL